MAAGGAQDASDGVLREHLAVLGSPISHSKSPAIHAAAYEAIGVDWAYGREELDVAALAPFLASRGAEWRGFSLTMPLKEEAHRIATVLDPVAAESGVVNTLLRIASGVGDGPRWAGFNTDVAGLAAAIQNAGLDATRTLVIGAGATAVSALLAARRLGAAHIQITARRAEALDELVERFGGDRVSAIPMSDLGAWFAGAAPSDTPTLVISTVPGAAGGALELPEQITRIPLFDVAYDPWPSPLAERWTAAGGTSHPGTDMLVEQAVIQIRIFHGGDPGTPLPDEARVREAMRAAL